MGNHAGGLEGGITTGQPLVCRAAMKPISTLMTPLGTVDLRTGAPAEAVRERSDVCAVPAAGVVAEAMVAIVLAGAVLEKFGGDSLAELRRIFDAYLEQIRARGAFAGRGLTGADRGCATAGAGARRPSRTAMRGGVTWAAPTGPARVGAVPAPRIPGRPAQTARERRSVATGSASLPLGLMVASRRGGAGGESGRRRGAGVLGGCTPRQPTVIPQSAPGYR